MSSLQDSDCLTNQTTAKFCQQGLTRFLVAYEKACEQRLLLRPRRLQARDDLSLVLQELDQRAIPVDVVESSIQACVKILWKLQGPCEVAVESRRMMDLHLDGVLVASADMETLLAILNEFFYKRIIVRSVSGNSVKASAVASFSR